MRVISGTAKGHKLISPPGRNTRPTTDRTKESLFNILALGLSGCCFLDLFCGSGAIGIEALSRNADKAVFIDESKESIKSVLQNLNHTKLIDKAEVYCMDVLSAIKLIGAKSAKFDMIFMDPPYAKDMVSNTLEAIYSKDILDKDGVIIVERGSKNPFSCPNELEIIREKDYKTTTMTFLKLKSGGL